MDDEVRMEALRVDISARLRNICSDMSDTDFAAMVESIMLNARRSETRNTTWGPPAGRERVKPDCPDRER